MHYAPPQTEENSRKYYYSSDPSKFHFWIEYLRISSTPGDRAFLEQSRQMDFFSGIFTWSKCYEDNIAGKCILPSVSYCAMCMFYQNFDIKFDHDKCDLCILCMSLFGIIDVCPWQSFRGAKRLRNTTTLAPSQSKCWSWGMQVAESRCKKICW